MISLKMLFVIPVQFMRKNKGQTISILFGMILSVAMIVAVSSLMYSAQVNKTESDRERYGDYHYYLWSDDTLKKDILEKENVEGIALGEDSSKKKKAGGFILKEVQTVELKAAQKTEDNAKFLFVTANQDCRKMIKRNIIEGSYPSNQTEIAMDRYSLRIVGAKDMVGSEVTIGKQKFTLSGIMEEPTEFGDISEAYVSGNYPNELYEYKIYFKFDEKKSMYKQVEAFLNAFPSVKEIGMESNGVLINDLTDRNIERLFYTVKGVLEDEESNFITLLMKLRDEFHMTSGLAAGILVIFSVFIIYSIFHISTSKRQREYGILQTIGAGRKAIFFMLVIELFLLLLISYPVGVLLGVSADKLLFQQVGALFSGNISLMERTHRGGEITIEFLDGITKEVFYVHWEAICFCAVFMLLLLFFISLLLSREVSKKTIVEVMSGENKSSGTGRIYSLKNKSLLGKLTNRFMFSSPKNLIAIVLSISVGGVLILSTNYITINSSLNNEMVLHSGDDLSSDIKISIGSEEMFDYGITQAQFDQIKSLSGVAAVSGFRYLIGEFPIAKEQLKWKAFWPEIAHESGYKQTADIMNRFHGEVTETEDGYKIKTNVYGYDKESLDILKDFVLDGEINPDKMEAENGIILRTLVDAQNNHDGLVMQPGDTITLKTLKKLNADKELLWFEGEEKNYQEKEFKVLAVVSDSIIHNTENIGDYPAVIMTNQQMRKLYQVEPYNMLSIQKEKQNDKEVLSKIQTILSDTGHVKIVDNSLSIQAKNAGIRRAEILLYSISVLLMIIALFHVINTMFHLLDARRYSFAVLRAMGITETDFYKMLVIQALKYAALTCAAILVIYIGIVQRVISHMLIRVYTYMNQLQGISPGIALLVIAGIVIMFLLSVTITARRILRLNIVEELKCKL